MRNSVFAFVIHAVGDMIQEQRELNALDREEQEGEEGSGEDAELQQRPAATQVVGC